MTDFNFCPRCTAPLVDRLTDGEPRRACSAVCGFVHFDNPTPIVAAVVEHDGQLIVARNRAWPQNVYGLITGFLERGEAPEAGVLREVKEELGLDAAQARLIGVYPLERRNQVIIGYHVVASGTVTLNHELVEYRHVSFRPVAPGNWPVWREWGSTALCDWLRSWGFDPELDGLNR